MKRFTKFGMATVAAVLGALLLLNAQSVTAHFAPEETITTVAIDGVNYGKFDRVDGVLQSVSEGQDADQSTITLGRDFVTDPSLYLWARNAVSERIGLRDIELIEKSLNGEILRRYTLSLCQPISWTVETAAPGSGGFHETVKLAVQKISIQ